MDLTRQLELYMQECVDRGATTERASMREVDFAKRGFQLAYQVAHCINEIGVDERRIGMMRRNIDALAKRHINDHGCPNAEGEQVQVVLDSFESERAIFRKYFPKAEVPSAYS